MKEKASPALTHTNTDATASKVPDKQAATSKSPEKPKTAVQSTSSVGNSVARPKPGLGLSIKSLINKPEDNGQAETSTVDTSLLAADPFSQEKLEILWKEYADLVRSKTKESFYSTLTIRQPQVLENNTILYRIDNSVQKMDFEREQTELMEFLRKNLNNFSVKLELEINKTAEKNNFYTDGDKLTAMAEHNPVLKDLVSKLGLDVEF